MEAWSNPGKSPPKATGEAAADQCRRGRPLSWAIPQVDTHWTRRMSGAIWTGSSSCPWLTADASLTAPPFSSHLLGFCHDQLGWRFVVLGFFQVEMISHFF